jgi:hypothetical protein
MRGILVGFGAIPAHRSTMAVRATPSLAAWKSNWTGTCKPKSITTANPWLLAFLYPRFHVLTPQQPPSRQLRPRSFQAAKKTPVKGRKLQEFKTLLSSDVKYIEWWRVKVENCTKPVTRELMKKLSFNNLLGLNENLRNGNLKTGKMNAEILETKRQFPHEILMYR